MVGGKSVKKEVIRYFERKEKKNTIVFPYHRGKEVPTGTANSILKQAGLK